MSVRVVCDGCGETVPVHAEPPPATPGGEHWCVNCSTVARSAVASVRQDAVSAGVSPSLAMYRRAMELDRRAAALPAAT